ncbi:MAG: hydrogenase maturation protease [Acidobacteria bacterium]|nr:hydrogenase maturation protease [Acidobacteriota bacterium]
MTVVLGLGNPLLSDDAVGLRVAAALQRLLQESPVDGVRVLTSTRAGFELIDLLAGATHAIIVDCLAVPCPVPGAVRRLTLQDFAGSARLIGAHDISVAVAFDLAAALGIRMPETVEIFGVEGVDTQTVSEQLTPEVEAAVASLASELHAHLKQRTPSQ